MSATTKQGTVRERIMATAFDLFYRQGYRATGINQVIAESGVAKASFYDHFKSKDDLLVEYVREMARLDYQVIRDEVAKFTDPHERFFAPFNILEPWFHQSDYRGCPFQNVLAEAPTTDPRVQSAARHHRDNLRALLYELTLDLMHADPRLAVLDPTHVSDAYLIAFEGSIAVAVGYRDCWPVKAARRAVEGLLQPS